MVTPIPVTACVELRRCGWALAPMASLGAGDHLATAIRSATSSSTSPSVWDRPATTRLPWGYAGNCFTPLLRTLMATSELPTAEGIEDAASSCGAGVAEGKGRHFMAAAREKTSFLDSIRASRTVTP